ncbi:hypothetical protein RFN58_07020 [Streptomyces iakyrus]|uniref:hypothetical protein n=1 Tax=Streptomyces iakyrus TaxID=68219 RepID=UPI0005245EB6|nr:hypothetical protein [Streptomyces iakyrus]
MTFHYRDTNGQQLEVTPAIHLHDGQPAVTFFIPLTATNPNQAGPVRIPLDHIEELVAGLRDTARQAAAGPNPQHLGNSANAEDCPACWGTNPPYPFLCPGGAP